MQAYPVATPPGTFGPGRCRHCRQARRGFGRPRGLCRLGAARSGLLGVAALEIFDHLFDGRDFILEPVFQFFQGFDPLFAGVETPAAPWASACEA